MKTSLPVEFLLLLRCCSGHLHDDLSGISSFIEHHHPDWGRVLHLVQKHKLVPVVQRVLSGQPAHVPPGILDALADLSERSLKRIRNLNHELMQIRQIFDTADLPFIPLKGPLMAHQLYGDSALRQTRDLDLLVHPDTLSNAISLLSANGYILLDEYFIKNPEKRRLFMMGENHVRFRHPLKKIIIELHWAVSRNFTTLSTDHWFAHAIRIEAEGKRFRTFSMDDYFVILVAHGIKHQYELLFWLYDIAHLLKISPASRESLIEHATAHRCGSAARVSIALADHLFGVQTGTEAEPKSLSVREKFLYHQCLKIHANHPSSEKSHFLGKLGD